MALNKVTRPHFRGGIYFTGVNFMEKPVQEKIKPKSISPLNTPEKREYFNVERKPGSIVKPEPGVKKQSKVSPLNVPANPNKKAS